MEMSQGTYTFLVCFAGFWLVWGLIVILCCFCSSVQRRLKRQRREQLREQCLRPLETEPLDFPALGPHPSLQLTLPPPPHREPPHFYTPHPLSPSFSLSPPRGGPSSASRGICISSRGHHAPPVSADSDPCGLPPCYEEAVLMEDPPPPYNEVLAEPPRDPPILRPLRDGSSSSSSSSSGGGTLTLKAPPRAPRLPQEPDISKTNPPEPVSLLPLPLPLPGRGCSTLIRLPPAPSRRWDSLGRLPALGLGLGLGPHRSSFPLEPQVSFIATVPREARTHTHAHTHTHTHPGPQLGLQLLRELGEECGLPTAYPLLGRSTAV